VLALPRQYQTIVICGAFSIGVSRQYDVAALHRFYHHLVPGGLLLLEGHPAYRDDKLWPLWQKAARTYLPEPWPQDIAKPPEDGRDYKLCYRLVAVDQLEQRTIGEMRMLLFKDRQRVADDTHTSTSNYYFRYDLQLLLEQAGFMVEAVKGDWTDADVTADHETIVYFARK
jgi:hypothetical protein